MEKNNSSSQPPALLPYQTTDHQTRRQALADPGLKPIRPYNRSQLPRLQWTKDLHRTFCNAVQTLGGPSRATPKKILEHMHVEGITITHIKSHLQMYRNMSNRNVSKEQLIQVARLNEGSRAEDPMRPLEGMPCHTRGWRGAIQQLTIEDPEEVYRRKLVTANTNAVPILVPERGGKRHHAYILFKEILVGSSSQTINEKPTEVTSLALKHKKRIET